MAPVFDRPGFWGEPTSTLDWCEENYAVSFYVAEFWNTVSNLIMIVPPVYGAIQTVRDGLETRYLAAFLGLAAVGIGSWCFHMTLKYEMQLLDELPMIYSCCIFVYCLYECFKHKNTRNYLLAFILVLFSGIVTIVYLEWKEPVFHQVMYGFLVGCLVLRSIYIVTWVYPWLRPLAYTSLGVFLMGFILWNVDNILCDNLREVRQKVPFHLLGALTQFHAWWHILTGLGSYLHILFSFCLAFGLLSGWRHLLRSTKRHRKSKSLKNNKLYLSPWESMCQILRSWCLVSERFQRNHDKKKQRDISDHAKFFVFIFVKHCQVWWN
ncbi:alkaline ceramidase 3 isoform X2 [Hypanus sabinus]|uniref:alkaline ceramidase 3 isoform X2 n=1 Tax=Hypanus sabinus TaxID=79690 RepID=UPI0028C3F11F|nr:alkaline ceramidase 3 isoform X2 [Hypanus sabinus]